MTIKISLHALTRYGERAGENATEERLLQLWEAGRTAKSKDFKNFCLRHKTKDAKYRVVRCPYTQTSLILIVRDNTLVTVLDPINKPEFRQKRWV